MRTVMLSGHRMGGVGVTAWPPSGVVSGERVIARDETRAGDAPGWIATLLGADGLPVIGVMAEAVIVVKQQTFSMYQGDSLSIMVTVTGEDGNRVDLTGAEIAWTLDTPGTKITKRIGDEIVVTDPTQGVFEVILAPGDSDGIAGVYRQQARIVDAVGQASVVMDGYVTIRRRIREE